MKINCSSTVLLLSHLYPISKSLISPQTFMSGNIATMNRRLKLVVTEIVYDPLVRGVNEVAP